ncbi:MAG TPA: tetratricopeptide repeat protein [Streptosporangiaceae bacterium]|nr:tetratricopeptide repeat protein [Streptosporangiaceae bacterium]
MSGTSGGSPSSPTGSRSTGRGSRRGTSSRSSRGSLGAGLIEVPPIPDRDPATAVLADPQVQESRRFCASCERPVGRGHDGLPGLAEGFCRNCGSPYSFVPKLVPGELVGGQYEVLGCLAHGGLGWIYLAKDRNVSDSWRVLKGLLNTGDADAMAAAVAERQFLAAVDHPNIVRIYNFVQHADRLTGENAGYIVMEYVGGKSLKEILAGERAARRSVPLPHALAYAIEVLPALGYLHSRGLVYCDFKPDNVIQSQEQLKLIDMGGVRRVDDDDSPIYGTVGYQAPEIADDGPGPSSDLYTVGRALAVLTFEFSGYQSTFANRLPDPDKVPLLAEQESFYRLLRRSTDPDPLRRFATAAEMAQQLTGVLREVLAVADGVPRPAFSALFSPELQAIGATTAIDSADPAARVAAPAAAEIVAGLPVPQVDTADAAAGYLATLSTLDPAQRTAALVAAVTGAAGIPPEVAMSAETRLALARALVLMGDTDGAGTALAELAAMDLADWQAIWYEGLRQLAAGAPPLAAAAFDAVCDALPGELAPKLALALAAEAAGDRVTAARYYQLVWTVDRSYVSAAFGLARVRLAAGDRPGAIAAVAAVPPTSSHYLAAQIAAVRIQLARPDGQAGLTPGDLLAAGARLDQLTLDAGRLQQLTAEVLQTALGTALAGQAVGSGRLLGCELTERALRFGLERSYRALARLAPDQGRRIELVDRANEIRPRTWL